MKDNKIIKKPKHKSKVKEDYAIKLKQDKKHKKKGALVYTSHDEIQEINKRKGKKRKVKKIEKLSNDINNNNQGSTILIQKKSKEDMPLSNVQKLKNILSYGFVCILAVILGFVSGNMYVNSISSASYDFAEAEYRYSDGDLALILSSNKDVATTNALYAFVIAENNIMNEEYYICESPKGTSFTSPDIAPTQSIYSYRKKDGKNYEYLTVTEGIMSVCEKVITSDGGDNFDIWRSKSIQNGSPVFSDNPSFKMTYDEARNEYGTDAMNPIPYVVSNKTIHESYKSNPASTGLGTKNDKGNYNFTLKLNTTQSVMNYVKQMKHMSELKNYPVFFDITINFELDSEFRFVSMDIVENYRVTYFGVPATCHAEMHQVFSY